MYQSPDFIKVPVKVEEGFASYCIPQNGTYSYNQGENPNQCHETSYSGSYVGLFGEIGTFICFNNESGDRSL